MTELAAIEAGRPAWGALLAPAVRDRWAPLLHVGADLGAVALHDRAGLWYLATPYSLEVVDDAGRWCPVAALHIAGQAACWAERLRRVGVTAISPIVQSDRMVRRWGFDAGGDPVADPLDGDAWVRWCRPLLCACDGVIVPPVEGWQRSVGIWGEVVFALSGNRRVFLLEAAP